MSWKTKFIIQPFKFSFFSHSQVSAFRFQVSGFNFVAWFKLPPSHLSPTPPLSKLSAFRFQVSSSLSPPPIPPSDHLDQANKENNAEQRPDGGPEIDSP